MSLVYLRENGLEGIGRFYSTYRGIVINNEDPLKLNRLQIEVPDITQTLVWAYPKGQPGPLQSGAKYLTPEINDVVFVEFQSGDPNYPLWSYCGWAKTQVPPELEKKEVIGIVTPNGNKIFLDDETNTTKILLKVSEDKFHEITLSPEGVIIKTPTPITQETQSTWDQTAKEDHNIRGKLVIFNDGEVGTTMTDKLLQRLNKIEEDINNLKLGLTQAAAVATPMDGGKAAFLSLAGYANTPLVKTVMADIEHQTVKQ